MKIIAEKSDKFEPLWLPDDVYIAEIVDIREMDKDKFEKPTLSVDFKIIGDATYLGKKISSLFSARITEKTKLGILLNITKVGFTIGSETDLNLLIGRRCRIVTKTKNYFYEDEQQKKSYIAELLPLKEE